MLPALSYAPQLKLDNTIYLFAVLIHTSILLSTNNCSLDLYNGEIKTVLFFTQGWINSYWLLPALSCLFICTHLHSDESSWYETLGVSLSREFICDSIVVGVVFVAISYLSISFTLMFIVVGLLQTCSMYLLVFIWVVFYIGSTCITIFINLK